MRPSINVRSVYSDNPHTWTPVEPYWPIQNVDDTCKKSLIYTVHTSRHACRNAGHIASVAHDSEGAASVIIHAAS